MHSRTRLLLSRTTIRPLLSSSVFKMPLELLNPCKLMLLAIPPTLQLSHNRTKLSPLRLTKLLMPLQIKLRIHPLLQFKRMPLLIVPIVCRKMLPLARMRLHQLLRNYNLKTSLSPMRTPRSQRNHTFKLIRPLHKQFQRRIIHPNLRNLLSRRRWSREISTLNRTGSLLRVLEPALRQF